MDLHGIRILFIMAVQLSRIWLPRLLPRAFHLFGVLAMLCACCPYAGSSYRNPVMTRARAADRDDNLVASAAPRRKGELAQDPAESEPFAPAPSTASTASSAKPAPKRERPSRVALPKGRDIATLHPSECRRLLTRAGVRFESVPSKTAPNIAEPVQLLSPLEGVSFGPRNGNATHGMLDCRLALALLAWAPSLQSSGVVKVEHYSTYRPGAKVRATRKSSGHARAMAIDAARFHLRDGTVLDVDRDWDERERGGDPCELSRREDEKGKLLRRLVCDAVSQGLFQVVLTPHHDRTHQNHVHMELVPEVEWSYIH